MLEWLRLLNDKSRCSIEWITETAYPRFVIAYGESLRLTNASLLREIAFFKLKVSISVAFYSSLKEGLGSLRTNFLRLWHAFD